MTDHQNCSADIGRGRIFIGGSGLGLAAAAAALLGSEIVLRDRPPVFPLMFDAIGRTGFPRRKSNRQWRNDGVRANKTYRLKGVRP